MTVHLIKLAVGIDDFEHLRKIQRQRRRERGKSVFYTRNTPRRAEELLDDGSIYWVIKGYVRARQLLKGFTSTEDDEGQPLCVVRYDMRLVPTVLMPKRPFQGWRYLEAKDAPADRVGRDPMEDLPPKMVEELRSLGLL
ncbi:MAG TPA: DUF1489 domain-containing protein [Stellaceae bacterium]|nr:DUF1489 domain-containing protein [Stellaceae bacterium]